MNPGVGRPSDDHRAACQYTGLTEDGPPCGEPATVHVMTAAWGWGTVSLASCDRHAGIARRAGAYRAEHPHRGVCGLPAALWTDEECVIDDSGVEPEPAGVRELELIR